MNKGQRDRVIKMQELMMDESFSDLSQSQYSLKDVVNLQEFKQLSQQIKLEQSQQERLVDKFYLPTYQENKYKFQRKQPGISAYQEEYRRWKAESQSKVNDFKSTYESTLALVSKQKQMQEVKRLIKQSSIENAVFQYSPNNHILNQINQQYSQSLNQKFNRIQKNPPSAPKNNNSSGINNFSFVSPPPQQAQIQRQLYKQKQIQMQAQKQLLQRMRRINEQERREEEFRKKEKQLQKTCFKDLITRPPILTNDKVNKSQRKQQLDQSQKAFYKQIAEQIPPNSGRQSLGESSIKQKGDRRYRLNVSQILKIPHRLFLIFYSQNYHQIIRLSSPQDLKRINQYREEALARQTAVQKLQRKVAEQGSELITKLPSKMKEKLFKVLYQKDLDEQKYWQNK